MLGLTLSAVTAHAQLIRENELPIEGRGVSDLATGLVLDSTVTVLGREFFSAFADAWRELDGQQRYSVTVHETPTARLGSTIRVQSRGRVLYQSLLRPNRQEARQIAQVVAGDTGKTRCSSLTCKPRPKSRCPSNPSMGEMGPYKDCHSVSRSIAFFNFVNESKS